MKRGGSESQLSLWTLLAAATDGVDSQLASGPAVAPSPTEVPATSFIPAARREFAERAPLVLMDASDSRGMSPAVLAQVVPARLSLYAEKPDAEEATDIEAMLYISSASFTAPLSHSFANIFFYLCARLLPQGREVLEDAPTELGLSERHELTTLKSWIYRQQVKHLKEARRRVSPAASSRKATSRADGAGVAAV
ncbi:MAG TPA: hypothetical protein VJZ91_00905 [Blastocatellia bacterium]|nr:hypothetical protein [Blastocatellia bacterium]